MTQLRITEIFHSLQGEASSAGWPTVFVRLTGCPLRCVYCDTEYAFQGGTLMALDEVVAQINTYGSDFVCVTGGEPLAQKVACLTLLTRLCDDMLMVSLETSGAMDIEQVDLRAQIIMDLKTPSSGEESKNRWENLQWIKPNDVIKIVIGNRVDYDWACAKLNEHGLAQLCEVIFSPVYGQQSAPELAEWILQDRLPVRFQMQLHKVLWGDTPGK